MAHIHLAWELGGGLGHAGRLKMLALALQRRGHHVSMSLRDLGQTGSVLGNLHIPRFQAPVWLHRTVGMPSTQASLAEILLTRGYLDPTGLAGLAGGWHALFRQLQPDLVVADYAPTAILAARSMGIRSASVGIGFYSPPPRQPLPCLRDWEMIPPQRLAAAEARVLQTANAVLAEFGAPPFFWGADLLLGGMPLLCTWPELDHYGRHDPDAQWYGPNFLPRTGVPPAWPPGSGPKVFAYLKTAHADHAAVLQALAGRGCRVLCYLPEVAAGKAPPVTSPNILYAGAPVSLDAALSEAALCVCHGGEATLAQALLAGVPVLLMPMQLEQFLMSRRVQAMGAGINAAMRPGPVNWGALIGQLLELSTYKNAAQAFAQRHRGFNQQGMADELAEIFEQQLS